MKIDVFNFYDFSIGIIYLIILLSISYFIKNIIPKKTSKYLFWSILFSILFSFFYGAFYHYLYVGGDTFAYWQGSISLNNLLFENPSTYVNEIITPSVNGNQYNHYNHITGYPPAWIYRESESFFVSKIFSFIGLVSLNSYLTTSFIVATIKGVVSWQLFEFVRQRIKVKHFYLAISILFMPTVAFWCSGISKDTITFISTVVVVLSFFEFFILKQPKKFLVFLRLIVFSYILFKIRPFMLYVVFIPLILAWVNGYINKNSGSNKSIKYFLRTISIFLVLISVFVYIQVNGGAENFSNKYLNELVTIQQDFKENITYTGEKYDLPVSDYSLFGMLQNAPVAIFTSFYRPLIFEANDLMMLVSSLEGTFLLILTFYLIVSRNIFYLFSNLFDNPFLIFSLVFCLLLGFFVGFTSIIFGVLIRFKAPILPFLTSLLFIRKK